MTLLLSHPPPSRYSLPQGALSNLSIYQSQKTVRTNNWPATATQHFWLLQPFSIHDNLLISRLTSEKSTFLRNSPFLTSIWSSDCDFPKRLLYILSTFRMPWNTLEGHCCSKRFPSVKTSILSVVPFPCTLQPHAHTQLSKCTAASAFQGKLPERKLRLRASDRWFLIHTIRKTRENGTWVLTTASNTGQKKTKDGALKQLHSARGWSQRLLSPESGRDNTLPAWQGLSKWKRCARCEQPLPIPTYFGGSDKEREEMHTFPLGVQQRGDLLFQSLTGTLFFSLFLWQPLVFLLLHYFVLLQQKGQDGFWTERDLSWEWIIQAF